jgi:outer membrane lipoprotein-sorting protein
MKTIKLILLAILLIALSACSSDDTPPHAPAMDDVTLNMDENPTSDLVTTMVATDSENHTLTYAIVSQTPANSVAINSANGEIYINNPDAFDYEQISQIVGMVTVSDGSVTREATHRINV